MGRTGIPSKRPAVFLAVRVTNPPRPVAEQSAGKLRRLRALRRHRRPRHSVQNGESYTDEGDSATRKCEELETLRTCRADTSLIAKQCSVGVSDFSLRSGGDLRKEARVISELEI